MATSVAKIDWEQTKMFKKYLEGFKEIRQIDKEYTWLFKLGGMDYQKLSNPTRSIFRVNAAAYGTKQTFVAMLPTFAEQGLLKIGVAELEKLLELKASVEQ